MVTNADYRFACDGGVGRGENREKWENSKIRALWTGTTFPDRLYLKKKSTTLSSKRKAPRTKTGCINIEMTDIAQGRMGQNMDMTLNAPLLSFVQLPAKMSIHFNV